MISLFQAIVALVLLGLGLGALYYFKIRKSPEKPQEDTDVDIDPLEDLQPQAADPVKTTPVVADEPDTNEDPEVVVISKPEPEDEDKPVQPTPTTTPAKPIVPEKPKPTLKPVVTNGKRVLTNEEVDVFLGKIQKSMVKAGQCQADAFKKAFRTILKDKQFDKETIAKMLDPNRSRFFPMDAPGAKVYDGFIPNDVLPEYQKIFTTQIRYALEKCQKEKENRPITKPAVVKPAVVKPAVVKPVVVQPVVVQPTPTTTPAKPIVPEKPKPPPPKPPPTPEQLEKKPPDIFMETRTWAEAKAKCKSLGRRLCTDPEICNKGWDKTMIFQDKYGNIPQIRATWVGPKPGRAESYAKYYPSCPNAEQYSEQRRIGGPTAQFQVCAGPTITSCHLYNSSGDGKIRTASAFACCGKA